MQLVLIDSPSLKLYLAEALAIAYQLGQDFAVQETGLDYGTFSGECPYALRQILGATFLPIS